MSKGWNLLSTGLIRRRQSAGTVTVRLRAPAASSVVCVMMMHHNVQRTAGIGAGILRRLLLLLLLLLRVRGGRRLHSAKVGVGSIHPSRGVHIDELRKSSHILLLLRLLVLLHGLELSHGHKSRISL